MIRAIFPFKPTAHPAQSAIHSSAVPKTQRNPVQNEDRMTVLKSLTAALMLGLSGLSAAPAMAELNLDITSPVVEPMPFAIPAFVDEGGAGDYASQISRVVAADLAGALRAWMSAPGWAPFGQRIVLTGGAGIKFLASSRSAEDQALTHLQLGAQRDAGDLGCDVGETLARGFDDQELLEPSSRGHTPA